jgi:hypothetical protein
MNEENKAIDPENMLEGEERPLVPPTVPLFNIPEGVLRSMQKEAEKDLDKFSSPAEFVMNERKKHQVEVSGPTGAPPQLPIAPQPKKENTPVVSWAAQDLSYESLTMLFYLVLKEVSKDKAIKKWLKDMKIEVYDKNGTLLFP